MLENEDIILDDETMEEGIVFTDEDGEDFTLYIVDTTKIAGVDYALMSDTPEGEGEGYIFKMIEDGDEIAFEPVEDNDYDYIFKVFLEQLEDDIEMI